MVKKCKNLLIYEGSSYFRQRLILATLSGKSVKIRKIRAKDDNPGVRDFEANFIRMLDSITNGSKIEVNETGTTVFYQPGMLDGGKIEHECNLQRGIGYYLEALLCLAPFMRTPLNAKLLGVTHNQLDPSADILKMSVLPVIKRFLGVDEGLSMKVVRRGVPPSGGGEVLFTCPCRAKLRPVQYLDSGKIKRIRGIAWAVRVSPGICNRVVESARSLLNNFLPDIYIYTDHQKGSVSGRSPGYGLVLAAETTNGTFLCSEVVSNPKGDSAGPSDAEHLGLKGAGLLMEEIFKGGVVDSVSQNYAVLLMSLGDKDVSKIKSPILTTYTVQLLRHLRDYMQVMFKLDNSQEQEQDDQDNSLRVGCENKITMTCVGVGFRNLSKAIM